MNNSHIYRYNLDNNIINYISIFCNIHKYDDKKTYKEEWLIWIKDNENIIEKEKQRLNELGYKGDVIKKMYTAGRYYFRNKKNNNKTEIETKSKTKNIIMSKYFISIIDRQINRMLQENKYKPSDGYNDLLSNYPEIINEEIDRLSNNNSIDKKTINLKIKKLYKNRYFIISKYKDNIFIN